MQQAMSAVTAEQLQQLMGAFMSRGNEGGDVESNHVFGDVGGGGGGGGGNGNGNNVLEVTPEMLTQMMQHFMIHRQQSGDGGGD
jgi:hypothetical protein